ncbi:DNA polymerase III subunit gamma and tau [Lawsonella sp.]|uniref:DNA polymerase III subunit gamma and tau n=1 Tax=Lawsonella sp. TaxID=2041415 RepID=UPI0025B8169E|nr:DNA polymerase III subunit gamma and tau [Lawsonella sp.]
MALYHKYRPATFAEVVGQEHVTEPLMQALDSGHINHAYLFSGPRGTGKTSSARILARSLNCAEGPTSTPCGKCASCLALAPGGPGNLDVTELDAASHGGVDDARELRDRAFYAPAESRYRVFIIDEAHMVTSAGFNALLKIVEEPPEHLIFIFATTEPEKVLPTIKSRTHHYPFRLLAPNAMRGLLERICEQEGVKVDPAVYPLVIRAGGGSPRDALSVLDQLMAGSGEDGITYQSALALLGATDVALIDDAVNALAAADRSGMFGTIERVIAAGHDPRRFTSDLLDRFRDLIMLQSVKDAADTGLVDAPDDQMERMIAQAKELGPATATRFADVLSTGLKDMRGATSPRLLLEIMSARMLLPATDDSYEALLQRVEQLERGVGSNISLNTPAHQNAAMEPPVSSAPHISREEAARNATEGTARIRAVMAEKKAKKEASQESQPVQAAASAQAVPAAQAASAGQSAQSASTAQSTPSTQTVESSENSSAASDLTAETFSNQWVAIRNAVRAQSRTLDVMLATARVVDYQPDTAQLSISHTSGPLVSRINEPRHIALLTDAIAHTLGVQVHVRCLTAQDAARSAGTSTTHDPAAQSASAQSHTAQSTSAQSYAERLQSARAHAKASPTGGVSHGGTSPASATPADPTGDATSSDGGPANSGPADSAPADSESATGSSEQSSEADSINQMLADAADPTQKNLDHRSAADIAIEHLQETLGATLIEDDDN